MKTLYLLRHAKAEAGDASHDDRRRALAPRGRRSAPAMAERMKVEGWVPERVLCSPAARTVETWSLMAPALGSGLPVETHEAIYQGGAAALLDLIREVGEPSLSLLVVGHNPTVEDLTAFLTNGGGGRRTGVAFATGALAVLDVGDVAWASLGRGGASLRAFLSPKDLASARDLGL